MTKNILYKEEISILKTNTRKINEMNSHRNVHLDSVNISFVHRVIKKGSVNKLLLKLKAINMFSGIKLLSSSSEMASNFIEIKTFSSIENEIIPMYMYYFYIKYNSIF